MYKGATFTVGNLFNGLSRAGVPMFLLLTGALLLDEERPFDAKRFYKTSFLSMALLFLFWLVFYAAWRAFGLPLLRGKSADPGHFWEYLLTLKGLYPQLWNLFMLLCWYLAAVPPTRDWRFVLYGLGLGSALLMVFGVQAYVEDIPGIRDYLVEANTLPAILYGAGLFTLISALSGDRTTQCPVVRELSRSAFGVYIIFHVVVLDLLVNILLPYKVFHEQYPLLYILTLFVLTYGARLLVVLPLSRVRGVKKLFHY